MCGIAGFSKKIGNKDSSVINAMLDSIAHRGPDGRGIEIFDKAVLGHVRLAIIDIIGGKQPIKSFDGRYTLLLNGEIYNYLELRHMLIKKGYEFKTQSDAEVLLYMYYEYREKALDFLNGMFAFAVYDNVKKSIFLARDHFGIKPLYYYCGKDLFVFASEIKALLRHPAVNAEVDRNSLNEYVALQMVLGENTLFKNIKKLEPASYLIIKDNRIVEKKEYWKLNFQIDDSKSFAEYKNELLELLKDSLSLQVRSDVPLGAYVSGGLDSGIVATLAAKKYAGRLFTFSGGFKTSKDYDETRYAKIITDRIKSRHFTVFGQWKDFRDNFAKLIYYMDEPAAGPGLLPQYMVSKLASGHVKVVLGGQGGDEVFGGYARYMVAYLEQCLKGGIFSTQEEGRHIVTLHSIIPNLPILKQYVPMLQKQFSSGLLDPMDRRYFKLINRAMDTDQIYSKDFLRDRDKEDIFGKFSSIFNFPQTKSYFNKMTHYDIKTLLPALLHVEDRVSMASSIESRVPLLDTRIVELTARMPPAMKFSGGRTKYILSQAAKNIVPGEILKRKDKMGFPTPFNEWCHGKLNHYIKEVLLDKRTERRGILDMNNIKNLIDSEGKYGRAVWGALCLETWFREFVDKPCR